MPEWLQALVRSDLAQILRNIGEGVIVTRVILWGLTSVHGFLLLSAASDDFRGVFIVFHELMAFFTYAWLSVISLGELVFLTLKRLKRYAAHTKGEGID